MMATFPAVGAALVARRSLTSSIAGLAWAMTRVRLSVRRGPGRAMISGLTAAVVAPATAGWSVLFAALLMMRYKLLLGNRAITIGVNLFEKILRLGGWSMMRRRRRPPTVLPASWRSLVVRPVAPLFIFPLRLAPGRPTERTDQGRRHEPTIVLHRTDSLKMRTDAQRVFRHGHMSRLASGESFCCLIVPKMRNAGRGGESTESLRKSECAVGAGRVRLPTPVISLAQTKRAQE